MPDKEEVNEDAQPQDTDKAVGTDEAVPVGTETATVDEDDTDESAKIEGLVIDMNEVGPCKVELKVNIPKDAVDAEMSETFDKLAPKAVVHGFRPGHAPRKLVERHYHDAAFGDVKMLLVARSWEQVMKEKDIRPLGDPDIKEDDIAYDEEKGFSYEVSIEIAPKFDLRDYVGLELEKPSMEVSDEELDAALDNIRRRNAVLEPVEDGRTKEDDVPIVDVDIKVDDEVVHSVSDQELGLSKDNWLRGIDDEFWKDLLGKKTGETASKTVILPDTYQKEEYRGKEGELSATIKDIKRPKLPELNDDFAKDMLFESLDELKDEMRKRLAGSKVQEAQAALTRQVEEKLLEMADFEVPADVLKSMADRDLARRQIELAYQGVPRDEIEKVADDMVEGSQQKAERDIRTYFIYQQIAEKEDITVSDAEFERRIALIGRSRGMTAARMREDLRKRNMLEDVRLEIRDGKTIDFLIDNANIQSADGETVAGSESEPSKKTKATVEKDKDTSGPDKKEE